MQRHHKQVVNCKQVVDWPGERGPECQFRCGRLLWQRLLLTRLTAWFIGCWWLSTGAVLMAQQPANTGLAEADRPSEPILIDTCVLRAIDRADVAAMQAGVLMEQLVDEGQTVEAGAVLARQDSRTAELFVERARTELTVAQELARSDVKARFARKSQEVAVAELARAREAVEKFARSVSQTELDRLQLLADRSTLEIEQAEQDQAQLQLQVQLKKQDVAAAEHQLKLHQLEAPFTGVVVQWLRSRGEWVEPGTPVARLVRLNRLKAEGFARESQLPRLQVGQPVTIEFVGLAPQRDPQPSSAAQPSPVSAPLMATGVLTFISPEIDPVNRQVRIAVEMENPDLLWRPGQRCRLGIQADTE